MYDVKEYKFSKCDCWFRNNCSNYDTENCHSGCKIYFQYYYLVNLANIPKYLQQPANLVLQPGKDIKEYKYLESIKENIVDWVYQGRNLYLYSDTCGNGKTSWAVKLMSKYFSRIWNKNGTKCRGLFINVDDFLMQYKSNINKKDKRFEEMVELIPTVDLIIWDDIGCTKLKDYDHSILFPLINSRLINGKANIYTSNVIDDDLDNNIGARLRSRILDVSDVVEFINDSQRKPKEE